MGQVLGFVRSIPLRLRCKTVDGQEITYTSWDHLMKNSENIIELDCHGNDLTSLPESIGNLTQLQVLYCNTNKLTTLPESIGNLTQLQTLYCSHNKFTTLPDSIGNLTQLRELFFSWNHLTMLPEWVGNLTLLQGIWCTNNKLNTLPKSIGNLTQLRELWCNCNRFKTFPEFIGNLTQLRELHFYSNDLTTLPIQLIEYRRLEHLDIQDNPIEMIPAPLQRMIDRMHNHRMHDRIYNDRQNVHSSAVQASVKKSIYNLLNDRSIPDLSDDHLRELIVGLPSDLLSDETKSALLEYMASSEEHSTLAITFSDLLKKVINRMEKSEGEVRKDLYQRLNEEMADAECKCFTGRLSRLVNVLVGFFDDIRIEISGAEQISVVIALVKTRHNIGDEDEVTPEAKAEIRTELEARGYETGVIEEWLAALE